MKMNRDGAVPNSTMPGEVPQMKYCWYTEMSLAEWGNGLAYYSELDPRSVYEVTGCYVTGSQAIYVRGYLWDGSRFSHRLTPGQRARFVRKWGLVRPESVRQPASPAEEASKGRLAAEYAQLKGRYAKLHRIIVGCEAGTPGFVPSCPLSLLRSQAAAMGQYLHCLEVRAAIEGVRLNGD